MSAVGKNAALAMVAGFDQPDLLAGRGDTLCGYAEAAQVNAGDEARARIALDQLRQGAAAVAGNDGKFLFGDREYATCALARKTVIEDASLMRSGRVALQYDGRLHPR